MKAAHLQITFPISITPAVMALLVELLNLYDCATMSGEANEVIAVGKPSDLDRLALDGALSSATLERIGEVSL